MSTMTAPFFCFQLMCSLQTGDEVRNNTCTHGNSACRQACTRWALNSETFLQQQIRDHSKTGSAPRQHKRVLRPNLSITRVLTKPGGKTSELLQFMYNTSFIPQVNVSGHHKNSVNPKWIITQGCGCGEYSWKAHNFALCVIKKCFFSLLHVHKLLKSSPLFFKSSMWQERKWVFKVIKRHPVWEKKADVSVESGLEWGEEKDGEGFVSHSTYICVSQRTSGLSGWVGGRASLNLWACWGWWGKVKWQDNRGGERRHASQLDATLESLALTL